MTTTKPPASAATPPTDPTPKPVAPARKTRRGPLIVIMAIALICLGALVSVLLYTSTSDANSVLAVRNTVERGQTISAEDLISVKVSVDPALRPLATDRADQVVGKRAALDMPAGGVVTASQVTDQLVPANGSSVVGISLTAAMLPADELSVGDPVRVVTTPGDQGEITDDDPGSVGAVVVGITRDNGSGNTVVNVEVSYASAPKVASRAATGKLAVVLDSREGS